MRPDDRLTWRAVTGKGYRTGQASIATTLARASDWRETSANCLTKTQFPREGTLVNRPFIEGQGSPDIVLRSFVTIGFDGSHQRSNY